MALPFDTATLWRLRVAAGDLLQFVGPSGAYAPDPGADWYLMVGDESALPAIAASLEHVPGHRPVIAVLLVDGPRHELELDCEGDLEITWMHRHADPLADDLLLRAVGAAEFPPGRVHGFVHGEAGETRAVRRHLLGDRGVARKHLCRHTGVAATPTSAGARSRPIGSPRSSPMCENGSRSRAGRMPSRLENQTVGL